MFLLLLCTIIGGCCFYALKNKEVKNKAGKIICVIVMLIAFGGAIFFFGQYMDSGTSSHHLTEQEMDNARWAHEVHDFIEKNKDY